MILMKERMKLLCTTLTWQMKQMPHTEIDDFFKPELLGALGGTPKCFCLAPLGD